MAGVTPLPAGPCIASTSMLSRVTTCSAVDKMGGSDVDLPLRLLIVQSQQTLCIASDHSQQTSACKWGQTEWT
jgi:hypothetical protein